MFRVHFWTGQKTIWEHVDNFLFFFENQVETNLPVDKAWTNHGTTYLGRGTTYWGRGTTHLGRGQPLPKSTIIGNKKSWMRLSLCFGWFQFLDPSILQSSSSHESGDDKRSQMIAFEVLEPGWRRVKWIHNVKGSHFLSHHVRTSRYSLIDIRFI